MERVFARASLLACTVLLGAAVPAAADSITFTFDCDIVGPTCTASTDKGTLTFTDSVANTNWVDVTLDLVSGDPQTFLFNFTGTVLTGYAFEATGTTVDYDPNDLKADGYNIGFFDLQVPDTGNISGDPFLTTLKLTDGSAFQNLDASMFNALTTNSALYAAVNLTGGQSWFGATTVCTGADCDGGGGGEDPVTAPEPASLLLLGSGLVAFAHVVRRRRLSSR